MKKEEEALWKYQFPRSFQSHIQKCLMFQRHFEDFDQSCRFDKGLHRSDVMVDMIIILLLSFALQDEVSQVPIIIIMSP